MQHLLPNRSFMKSYKNILFDFGGVLFNIDFQLTIQAFKDLGFGDFDNMFSQYKINNFFADFEKGLITDEDFYAILIKESTVPVNKEDIKKAWNKMLLSYRMESMGYLNRLQEKYKLYLLSNTNSIHYNDFIASLKNTEGAKTLNSYFTKAWYSHEIGFRKPDFNCYEFILEDAGILASETLFIDDTISNLEAAEKLGFQTKLMLPEDRIENFL